MLFNHSSKYVAVRKRSAMTIFHFKGQLAQIDITSYFYNNYLDNRY